MKHIKIDTPCIGICSTAIGDKLCRGCKRTPEEVIDWNRYDAIQKQVVFDQLGYYIASIITQKLTVIDTQQLQQRLDDLGIRYRDEQSPLCWAYDLLREGAHKIHQLENYGIRLKTACKNIPLVDLFRQIDTEIYELALLQTQH